jgi:hypothetical protein
MLSCINGNATAIIIFGLTKLNLENINHLLYAMKILILTFIKNNFLVKSGSHTLIFCLKLLRRSLIGGTSRLKTLAIDVDSAESYKQKN